MPHRLEDALIQTESTVETSLKAATSVLNAIKNLRKSVRTGNLKDIKKFNGIVEEAALNLVESCKAAKESWNLDEEPYFAGREFLDEILELAQNAGVNIYELDNRLFSYPCIIRLLPSERAVSIDKTREKRIRPSFFIQHLKVLQDKPVRFKPDAFLETLFEAYQILIDSKNKPARKPGAGVLFIEIYEILTLLPGQSREYSRQEFARDIYLLDQSGLTTSRKGYEMIIDPGSTLTKTPGKILTIVTKSGQEKNYGSVAFSKIN